MYLCCLFDNVWVEQNCEGVLCHKSARSCAFTLIQHLQSSLIHTVHLQLNRRWINISQLNVHFIYWFLVFYISLFKLFFISHFLILKTCFTEYYSVKCFHLCHKVIKIILIVRCVPGSPSLANKNININAWIKSSTSV